MEMDWLEIGAYVVGILGIVLGSLFAIKWRQAVIVLRELAEAFSHSSALSQTMSIALEDKKLTKAELREMVQKITQCLKEWADVYIQIMIMFGRK